MLVLCTSYIPCTPNPSPLVGKPSPYPGHTDIRTQVTPVGPRLSAVQSRRTHHGLERRANVDMQYYHTHPRPYPHQQAHIRVPHPRSTRPKFLFSGTGRTCSFLSQPIQFLWMLLFFTSQHCTRCNAEPMVPADPGAARSCFIMWKLMLSSMWISCGS